MSEHDPSAEHQGQPDPPQQEDAAGEPARDEPLLERVRDQERRQARAERTSSRSLWRTVAHVGALGWLIALPTVGGAYLGHRLDRYLGSGITYAMLCLTLGLCCGGYLLWRTFEQVEERELERRDP